LWKGEGSIHGEIGKGEIGRTGYFERNGNNTERELFLTPPKTGKIEHRLAAMDRKNTRF